MGTPSLILHVFFFLNPSVGCTLQYPGPTVRVVAGKPSPPHIHPHPFWLKFWFEVIPLHDWFIMVVARHLFWGNLTTDMSFKLLSKWVCLWNCQVGFSTNQPCQALGLFFFFFSFFNLYLGFLELALFNSANPYFYCFQRYMWESSSQASWKTFAWLSFCRREV